MAALSPTDVVNILDADEQVEKRAAWEAFEFVLRGDGDVGVTNGSHEDADEHTYTVHVESGIPSDCTCPAWEYQSGVCKHMVAVAIREPVLEAATEDQPVRADGGITLEEFGADDGDDDRPEDCECAPSMDNLPCWPCYRDGFEEPNANAAGESE
ncbi:SWIM zinc finger family protein [Halorubrum sp. AJ67]|uniref:SWIM zinc finger family protein n=1 Tax=Halorubrum sp. AJ67 TaxID=1173487 RepID=UPI0003DC9CD1|nr:SWIM zinc finger family protein [Halorubrum sp. AJ67]CDK38906.1 zinc finger SWIM domain protein [Halorubrum sp. AJ67]